MAKPTGFLEYSRVNPTKRLVAQRINDYREFEGMLSVEQLQSQAARCMDCGIPFCHMVGCPVKNLIPNWNDMVYKGLWRRAYDLLHSTNNLPEFTGRVCPAPCEPACTLAINQPSVSIKQIELQIIEFGREQGWLKPEPPSYKTGKRIAIIGSGPAGISAAQQLARKGHEVVLFEKSDRLGGLLRYGIPDFKLEKEILDQRLEQLKGEGVIFETNVNVGVDITAKYLQNRFHAILITCGAGIPRDLKIPGRELSGIHYAMDYLTQSNKRISRNLIASESEITAKDTIVVVIGGGDTGSDCVGTSRRQGAREIHQIELLPKPPESRPLDNPWPTWPRTMRTSSSHEEGCQRYWSKATKAFLGKNGSLEKIQLVDLEWYNDEKGGLQCREIPGTESTMKADQVFLAMGFLHVEHGTLVKDLGLQLDSRGNIKVDSQYMTTKEGVFAAGDSILGASLVVRAIYQARNAAEGLHSYLTK